jgi:hypothetical protein
MFWKIFGQGKGEPHVIITVPQTTLRMAYLIYRFFIFIFQEMDSRIETVMPKLLPKISRCLDIQGQISKHIFISQNREIFGVD